MKRKHLIAGLILHFPLYAMGQYDTIHVGLMTTVHLVFTSHVIEYDLGSGSRIESVNGAETEVQDVLITKAGVRLKLAAAFADFQTTNLFVETESAYFNFILVYSETPSRLSHYLTDDSADKMKGSASIQSEAEKRELSKRKEEKVLEFALADLASGVLKKQNVVPSVGQVSQRMKYFLNGIYVNGDYLFIRVNILNEGNVKFDLGYEGFFIRDRPQRGLKKTTKQIPEPVQKLLIVNGEISSIEKGREVSRVYVFRKFTIERQKIFTIEFWEDGQGQRKVELNIPAHHILSAKTI